MPARPPLDSASLGDSLNRYYAVLLGIATEEEIEAKDREVALLRASDDVCEAAVR